MCKIANYPKKISDSWLFVVRTEKVRLFFIFRAYHNHGVINIYHLSTLSFDCLLILAMAFSLHSAANSAL